ncbi:hypothetical protein P154DRAFT_255006 [Amniculicola lignicola CBS 123094]|uniref:Uncharacterized protein n=1 Tax=Amniculicola lignicola CBS 123094 TaxID=1392246 RepID=A0A6A5WYH9_9PLEO|nr:hypothetical protein P154DRAFT_255006 [Amniculicola lignicola CBS 123094]
MVLMQRTHARAWDYDIGVCLQSLPSLVHLEDKHFTPFCYAPQLEYLPSSFSMSFLGGTTSSQGRSLMRFPLLLGNVSWGLLSLSSLLLSASLLLYA